MGYWLIDYVAVSCTTPTGWVLAIIFSLVATSGLFVVGAGVGLIGIVTTLLQLIMAGASIGIIVAELSPSLALTAGSVEVLAGLVVVIRQLLGC